jgi:hypothetical protein
MRLIRGRVGMLGHIDGRRNDASACHSWRKTACQGETNISDREDRALILTMMVIETKGVENVRNLRGKHR